MVPKIADLLLPGVIPDKASPVINFTDEAVVQCDVTVVKKLL